MNHMLDIQSLFDIISIGFEEDNEKSQALWVYVCDLNLKKLWTMVSYSSKKKVCIKMQTQLKHFV